MSDTTAIPALRRLTDVQIDRLGIDLADQLIDTPGGPRRYTFTDTGRYSLRAFVDAVIRKATGSASGEPKMTDSDFLIELAPDDGVCTYPICTYPHCDCVQ